MKALKPVSEAVVSVNNEKKKTRLKNRKWQDKQLRKYFGKTSVQSQSSLKIRKQKSVGQCRQMQIGRINSKQLLNFFSEAF